MSYTDWVRKRLAKKGISFDKMPAWEKKMVLRANKIDYNIEQAMKIISKGGK